MKASALVRYSFCKEKSYQKAYFMAKYYMRIVIAYMRQPTYY